MGWLLTGAVLPDFVSRAPTILLGRLVGPVLPPGDYGWAAFAFSSLHTPFGFALVAAAVALAMPRVLLTPLSRPRAWALLTGGGVPPYRAGLAPGAVLAAAASVLSNHDVGPQPRGPRDRGFDLLLAGPHSAHRGGGVASTLEEGQPSNGATAWVIADQETGPGDAPIG